ncbi:MAG: hypothetical protein HMLKMBBP_02075 [Planctomycetes bacterium]|nr:hypothetical protein [Planctomycetota bacterium]
MSAGLPAEEPAEPLLRRLRIPLLVILVCALLGGLRASRSRHVGGDFLRYHRAGRLVATGRAELLYDKAFLRRAEVYAEERAADRAARGAKADDFPEMEFKYDPALAVLLAPVGALGPRGGWIAWGAWNGAMIAVTFLAAWAACRRIAPGASWAFALAPVAALLHKANSNHNLGQLNPSAIAPATVAAWLLLRGNETKGAASAAFGAVVKYMPGVMLLWAAVKRRWAACAALLATFAALWAALPAVVLGPSRFASLWWEHKQQRAHVYAGAAAEDLPGHSIKSFVYRMIGGTHYRTGKDESLVDLDVSVATLDPEIVRAVTWALMAALAVCVIRALRGPVRSRSDPRGPLEMGILVASLPLLSPETRAPHLLYLALPLTALTYGIVRAWRDGPRPRAEIALAAVALVLLQTDSETLFGAAAHRISAVCGLGWATALVLVALFRLRSRFEGEAPRLVP